MIIHILRYSILFRCAIWKHLSIWKIQLPRKELQTLSDWLWDVASKFILLLYIVFIRGILISCYLLLFKTHTLNLEGIGLWRKKIWIKKILRPKDLESPKITKESTKSVMKRSSSSFNHFCYIHTCKGSLINGSDYSAFKVLHIKKKNTVICCKPLLEKSH